ncbi:hypothetical protein Uis1B_1149 [Bifidobacterium margollesii]|uniref:DUF3566 domain-containing protein n=1 Tax=Bifidobacterium margollesii TaxID=2020964 RepID=A0A2N5J9Z2_9BIFI|nr:DUF3566 domain-containing protein [Bifidobacterium margollesii]PLS31037.1 hypothetical protein Uis1B_1149 [Bifidobacterium margollesii]
MSEQSLPNEEGMEFPEEHVGKGRTSRSTASSPRPLIAEDGGAREASGSAEPAPASFKPASKIAKPSERKSSVPRARRMKLSLTKIDPWSVTKVSFLLSIAGAIIQIVAVALIWALLNAIGLFDNITQLIDSTGLKDSGGFDIASILGIGKVLSATTIFSIFEIVLITVLATIGAFLYNITSALVGGLHVTLGDD